MPESTCAIELLELQAEIGSYLGFGRGENYDDVAWRKGQQQAIDSCIASGLHKFYFPPILPNDTKAHDWSFLKPAASLTLASGSGAIMLPGDFGGLIGELVLSSPTGQRSTPIPVVSQGMIDRSRALVDDATGPPQMAAISPVKGTTRERGQQFQLAVYPTADAEYVFLMAYTLAPNVLTAQHPFPYGGPVHRETILESCLAVAEARLDDEANLHRGLFMEQLRSSISFDRGLRPQNLGVNRDGPWVGGGVWSDRYDGRLVTNDGNYST